MKNADPAAESLEIVVNPVILEHYREVARNYGASSRSTMEDDFVREKEIEWITELFQLLQSRSPRPLDVLDLGCGNGYALERLTALGSPARLVGADCSAELLAIARGRELGCRFHVEDARALSFADSSFDLAYTERCLINILDSEGQFLALREVHRVLRPGGHFLMIECFLDGLESNNKARVECGLDELQEAHHNKYLDKQAFVAAVASLFDIVDLTQLETGRPQRFFTNFLSSYYFIARVMYPAMTKTEVVRNSEVAKFFSFLPPMGNYSPIQAYLLRRR
jgi:ubiquinone/menaquinone biosynthesis C-methylase UbiE